VYRTHRTMTSEKCKAFFTWLALQAIARTSRVRIPSRAYVKRAGKLVKSSFTVFLCLKIMCATSFYGLKPL
jgi:hypothetical protein